MSPIKSQDLGGNGSAASLATRLYQACGYANTAWLPLSKLDTPAATHSGGAHFVRLLTSGLKPGVNISNMVELWSHV
jgi:hypothetical protein